MYNLSVNKLPESLTPAVGGGIIDYESPNLDYAYNSVFENESDIHNYRIMPTQIKESMVLWYDISRQGCTNENMAENPVLRDLSGNDHDATCYNFNWTNADISGIKKYIILNGYEKSQEGENTQYQKTPGLLRVYSMGEDHQNLNFCGNFGVQNNYIVIFKIQGLPSGAIINFKAYIGYHLSVTQDGTYIIKVNDKVLTIAIDNYIGQCDIKIIEYPQQSYALNSDGKDCSVKVENVPVLIDYTIFIKKDIIKYPENEGWIMFDDENDYNSTLQYKWILNEDGFVFNSFGYETNKVNNIVKQLDVITPNSFNGCSINKGQRTAESTTLTLFGSSTFPSISMALYSLIVFNRTLTIEEIEWTKHNLVDNSYTTQTR